MTVQTLHFYSMKSIFIIMLASLASIFTISAQTCITEYANSARQSGVNGASPWTNVSEILEFPDDVPATIWPFDPLMAGDSTLRLGIWNFDIDIPCNAVITDLSFDLVRRNNAATGDVRDTEVLLKFPDFTYPSSNAAEGTVWTNSTSAYETANFVPTGGWGVVLTPEIVNDPLFGLILSAKNFSTTEEGAPEIDAVALNICYTVNGDSYDPITATATEQVDDLCMGGGNGRIEITASGGSGSYEYSIDGGMTWSASPVFPGTSTSSYHVMVRDVNSSCDLDLGAFYIGCNEDRVLQTGDAIYSCLPTAEDPITLAVDRVQPLHDLYQSGTFFTDVSSMIQTKAHSWTTMDLGGTVFGVTFDDDFNIYTGISSLYNLVAPVGSADLIQIDAVSGVPTTLATLPGNAGIGQVEYATGCDQLFVGNLDDGMIYRYDLAGNLLSTFDPLGADDGAIGLAPLGEIILGLGYNPVESRLYYSVWANDLINNGNRNSIRSISINPATCDFDPATDVEEVSMPFLSETEATTRRYSHPVLDIEIDPTGSIMILAESGYNSNIPATFPHQSRLLRYDGSTGGWTLDNNVPTGNQDYKYQIGIQNDGKNSLGGVDFAYAGIDAGGCTKNDGSFLAVTGDALSGVDCAYNACLYGLQYISIDGGNPSNSVLFDFARTPDSQQKGFFGDLDIVTGCCPCACLQYESSVTVTEEEICAGDEVTICVETDVPGPSFDWDTGETSQCISVTPGMTTTYTVAVSEGGVCSNSFSAEVLVSPSMMVTASVTDVTSCEMANGQIDVSVSGGSAPYEYSIDGGVTVQSTGLFTDVMAGTYMILIADNFGCAYEEDITVDGPGTLNLDIMTMDDTDCMVSDGSISVTVTGGTPPYNYSVDGGTNFQDVNSFQNMMGGIYMVVVEDDLGCLVNATVELMMPACFGRVGDLVFEDADGNGIQDPSEPGVPGVRVELYNDNDVLMEIQITDPDGRYLFEDVREGNYYVKFVNPDGFTGTDPARGGNSNNDSNVDHTQGEGTTPMFSVSPNENELSIDYGVYRCVQIGEQIWYDFNEDDLFNGGENGINGVRVEIYKRENGEWFLEEFQNSGARPGSPSDDGYFKFCVSPGDYYLKFLNAPSTFVRAVPNVGFNEAIDSDLTDRFGRGTTDQFTVRSGEEKCDIGAGYYLEGTVSALVWFDGNNNGLRDDEEIPMPGIQILAINKDGEVMAASESDKNGQYMLDKLPKDFYYVQAMLSNDYIVTQADQGSDESIDSDLDGSNGENTSNQFLLLPGESVNDIDIGIALSVLPVTWLDIMVEEEEGVNAISWSVGSEVNVSHYELQYSKGESFSTVATRRSLETNTQEVQYYQLKHDAYSVGTNYYRIKQYDLDGRFSFSDVVAIQNGKKREANKLNVYPNPTEGILNLAVEMSDLQSDLEVRIFDQLGRVISDVILTDNLFRYGVQTYELDLNDLQDGLYFIEVTADDSVFSERVFLKK